MRWILLSLAVVTTHSLGQVTDAAHERCKDAADYVGCIKIFSGNFVEPNTPDAGDELKKALKILSSRIENTSLRDFSAAIQPFSDSLAIAASDQEYRDSQLVADAKKVESALGVARTMWARHIEFTAGGGLGVPCNYANPLVNTYNFAMGGYAVQHRIKKGLFCITTAALHTEMLLVAGASAEAVAKGEALEFPPLRSLAESTARYKERVAQEKAEKKAAKKEAKRIQKLTKKCKKNPEFEGCSEIK